MFVSLSRRLVIATGLMFSAILLSHRSVGAEPGDGPVYELRVYTCEPGKLAALNERFRDHTMKIFARHGIENVAYWVPTQGPESETTLIYLLRHKSREAAATSWADFRNDPEWKQVAAASQEKYGKILAKAPESTYLIPTDYSPEIEVIKGDCLYELRTYTAAEGKLDALHERFRKQTDKLFAKHGMPALAYWKPMDEPKSKNVLIYVLEHQDLDAAQASWAAFMQDPDWQAARRASEVDGRLTAQRPERVYMRLTDYSPKK